MKIVIRRYQDGEKLKTVHIKQDISVTFGVEGARFVVREYRTGKKIRSVQAPACSITAYELPDDDGCACGKRGDGKDADLSFVYTGSGEWCFVSAELAEHEK